MYLKHESVVICLDKGEIENDVGEQNDRTGQVKHINEGRLIFEDFFSDGKD